MLFKLKGTSSDLHSINTGGYLLKDGIQEKTLTRLLYIFCDVCRNSDNTDFTILSNSYTGYICSVSRNFIVIGFGSLLVV